MKKRKKKTAKARKLQFPKTRKRYAKKNRRLMSGPSMNQMGPGMM